MSSNGEVKETLSRSVTDESLSSEILSDVTIIADIYKIIKDSATVTTNLQSVKNLSNKACIIKLTETTNSKGEKTFIGKNLSRVNEKRHNKCIDSDHYKIEFSPDDITIVGGSAITLYDSKINNLRERKEMKKLQEYIIKKTSDIDIIWWPRSEDQDIIITSSSSGIKELVIRFRDELQKKFNENTISLLNKIKSIKGFNNTTKLEIAVVYDEYNRYPYIHHPIGGNHNLSIQFNIKGQTLKICDIIIHDSGISQSFNWDGQIIQDLLPMNKDVMYVRPKSSKHIDYDSIVDNSINHLEIDGVSIAVPNIGLLIKQQLFAFKNFIKAGLMSENKNKKTAGSKGMSTKDYIRKALINLQRVEFLKLIIDNISISDEKNMENFSKIVNTSILSLNSLDSKIDILLKNVLTTTKDNINKLKTVSNLSNDEYLKIIINDLDTIRKGQEFILDESKSVTDKLSLLSRELFIVREYLSNPSITNDQKLKYKKLEKQIMNKQTEVAQISRMEAAERLRVHQNEQEKKLKEIEQKRKSEAQKVKAEDYKNMIIKRIQHIINKLRDIEHIGNKLDINYKRKVQEAKSSFIKDIVKIKDNEPITLFNKKDEFDNIVAYIEEFGNSLVQKIIYSYGLINSTSKAIWIGDRWLDPGKVDSKTLSIWMGDGWIKPNYVDNDGRIWTGFAWLNPGSIKLPDRTIWTGYEWVKAGGIDSRTGDFWTGSYWVKRGTVNSATGQLWNDNHWHVYDDRYQRWLRIQPVYSLGYGGTRKNKNLFNRTRRI